MSAQIPDDDLDGLDLDPEVIERLRDGTATRDDEIAKLQAWRHAAQEQGNTTRTAELDALISAQRLES
ncbi:hypothetical protein [Microbacterium sp. JZ31]|uniref:hypothetical protein n=1 Tax=Microbacterium sp. JZ31 TaxID=1906274 RepID=UPI0019318272|nr:hypothetical protein [Microbacterium sp. JZ31]